jgi:uroporphyrinogen decarboxylase
MKKKIKILNAVNRNSQDILPNQIDCTPEMKDKVKKLLNIEEDQIDERLDNHIKYLFLDDKVRTDKEKGIQYDVWGVGWDLTLTEGFHIRHHPLIGSQDLKEYIFPNPEEKLVSSVATVDPEEKINYFMLFDQGFTLFERSWLLRGYENVLTDFYYREKEINYLLDGITEFNIEMAKKVIKTGNIDGVYTGDDFGTQRGLVMSPETWRKFFKDRYKKLWEVYKAEGLPVFHHSCGNLAGIIPDLIEIGLDVLSPIQPEAMDPVWLSERFGRQLTFFGGISTQKTLPFGTPEDVRREITDRIAVLGKYQGYIISPSHEVTSDCTDENFQMLLSTLRDYRGGLI